MPRRSSTDLLRLAVFTFIFIPSKLGSPSIDTCGPMATSPANTTSLPADAIILAAGKGKRMTGAGGVPLAGPDGQPLPKVLYPVADKPMVWWVVKACLEAGVQRCIVVIGYGGEQVRSALAGEPNCHFVEQTEQLGTGHAARMAEPLFNPGQQRDVFVLAGDGPLIRAETLTQLLTAHRQASAGATLATAVLDDPTGYGRVLRDAAGGLIAIVEQKDATPDQLRCREVNPSYYCFRSDLLFSALALVKRNNAQGEYYLTDVPSMLKVQGYAVKVVDAVPPQDVHSVNNPEQLALVDGLMRKRNRVSRF